MSSPAPLPGLPTVYRATGHVTGPPHIRYHQCIDLLTRWQWCWGTGLGPGAGWQTQTGRARVMSGGEVGLMVTMTDWGGDTLCSDQPQPSETAALRCWRGEPVQGTCGLRQTASPERWPSGCQPVGGQAGREGGTLTPWTGGSRTGPSAWHGETGWWQPEDSVTHPRRYCLPEGTGIGVSGPGRQTLALPSQP